MGDFLTAPRVTTTREVVVSIGCGFANILFVGVGALLASIIIPQWRNRLLNYSLWSLALLGLCGATVVGLVRYRQFDDYFHYIFPTAYIVFVMVVVSNWILGIRMVCQGVCDGLCPESEGDGGGYGVVRQSAHHGTAASAEPLSAVVKRPLQL